MMMVMVMTIVMMTARQWHCQCALPQSLPTKRVVGFKGRCIFLSNIPSSSAHLWFKHSQHSRREKAKNQSFLISVVVRQDIKDVLMDFKGCCIFLSNISWSGALRKNIESICSYISACKTRHKRCVVGGNHLKLKRHILTMHLLKFWETEEKNWR